MGKLSGMNCRREKAGLPVDDEQEYLPLSWLSQADYCLRRAALLLNERVWVENVETAKGAPSMNGFIHSAWSAAAIS